MPVVTPPLPRAYLARYNVNDCLSAGYLKAPVLYTHASPDPGQIAPYHLLLFLHPVAPKSLDILWGDNPQDFPLEVQVRLPEAQPLWRITADYQTTPALAAEEGDIAIVVPFGLSARCVERVFCQNEGQRNEFLSVRYANVDPRDWPVAVKPEDGEGEAISVDLVKLENAIRTLPVTGSPILVYRPVSSSFGGLLAMDHALSNRREPESIEWIEALLAPVVSQPQSLAHLWKKLSQSIPGTPNLWVLRYLPSLIRVSAGCLPVEQVAPPAVPDGPERSITDAWLFCSIALALMESAPDASTRTITEKVIDGFNSPPAEWRPLLPEMTLQQYQKGLDLVASILRNQADIPDDLAPWPTVLGALLLFSLRPGVDKTGTWEREREQFRFTGDMFDLAVLFMGMRAGHEMLPTELRRGKHSEWIHMGLVRSLENLAQDWYPGGAVLPESLVTEKSGRNRPDASQEILQDGRSGTQLSIQVAPPVKNRKTIKPEKPLMLPLDDRDTADEDTEERKGNVPTEGSGPEGGDDIKVSVLAHSEQAGAPEQQADGGVTEPTSIPADPERKDAGALPIEQSQAAALTGQLRADIRSSAEVERLALHICRYFKWNECVRQTYDLTGRSYRLVSEDGRVRLETLGTIRPDNAVIWEQFQHRLQEVDDSDLSRIAEEYLNRALESGR